MAGTATHQVTRPTVPGLAGLPMSAFGGPGAQPGLGDIEELSAAIAALSAVGSAIKAFEFGTGIPETEEKKAPVPVPTSTAATVAIPDNDWHRMRDQRKEAVRIQKELSAMIEERKRSEPARQSARLEQLRVQEREAMGPPGPFIRKRADEIQQRGGGVLTIYFINPLYHLQVRDVGAGAHDCGDQLRAIMERAVQPKYARTEIVYRVGEEMKDPMRPPFVVVYYGEYGLRWAPEDDFRRDFKYLVPECEKHGGIMFVVAAFMEQNTQMRSPGFYRRMKLKDASVLRGAYNFPLRGSRVIIDSPGQNWTSRVLLVDFRDAIRDGKALETNDDVLQQRIDHAI